MEAAGALHKTRRIVVNYFHNGWININKPSRSNKSTELLKEECREVLRLFYLQTYHPKPYYGLTCPDLFRA
jgi:cysteinyl-tRNA synthetase